jgi:hypothetical protein
MQEDIATLSFKCGCKFETNEFELFMCCSNFQRELTQDVIDKLLATNILEKCQGQSWVVDK